MRKMFALGFILLSATRIFAQPIHHHPQKAAYASPAEWPVHPGQAHWPNPDPTMTCHLHVEPKFPYGAELDGSPFEVPFTLKLYHCDGRITSFDGEGFASVRWDETLALASLTPDDTLAVAGLTPPIMQGDPHGLKQWTGTVVIDPKQQRNGRFFAPHGWTSVRFQADAVLANGDAFTNEFWESFYSIADLSQPETLSFTAAPNGSRDYPIVSERGGFRPACASQIPRPSFAVCGSWGAMVAEINDWLPLEPIAVPWTTSTAVYNYTAESDLPNGRYEQRQDLDLHNGVRGILIDSGDAGLLGFTNRLVTFDPAVMGPGAHKEAIFWTQPFAATGESASALITVDVVVDPNAPPPVVTPPPPPVVKSCTGTVSGTSVDGVTISVTSGTVTCK